MDKPTLIVHITVEGLYRVGKASYKCAVDVLAAYPNYHLVWET